MSPFAWMVTATAVAALVALAADALERLARAPRRIGARWVWLAATCLALGVIASWSLASHPSAVPHSAAGAVNPAAVVPISRPALLAPDAQNVDAPWAWASQLQQLWTALRVPALSATAERSVVGLWLAASLAMLVVIIGSAWRLARERRLWPRQTVADLDVLVAPRFGPGLVGLRAPEIVVPSWITELDGDAQRAIVLHEDEHRAARDHLLLVGGTALLVTMPWNVGAWMLWRRLRRAIEFDCDARVIRRGVDPAGYAKALLHAWDREHGHWMPVPAFAERASGLGARVHHLLRPSPQGGFMRTTLGVLTAALLVIAACKMPRPEQAATARASAGPLVVIDDVVRSDVPPFGRIAADGRLTEITDTLARYYPAPAEMSRIEVLKGEEATAAFGERGKAGVLKIFTKQYDAVHGKPMRPKDAERVPVEGAERAADPATQRSTLERNIYNGFFREVNVPEAAQPKAIALIHQAQMDQEALYGGPSLAIWPRITRILDYEAAQLRALLTTDADRARFDANVQARRPGPGPSLEKVATLTIDYGVMSGIRLDPSVRDKAIGIARQAEMEMTALYEKNPADLAPVHARRFLRDAALIELLASDADRERFRRNVSVARGTFGVKMPTSEEVGARDTGTRTTVRREFVVASAKPVIDSQVNFAPGSATPRYPEILKSAGVTGKTVVQFVVDTTGAPELSSLKIVRSAHALFTAAVQHALPNQRFVPALVGGRPVRQLVQVVYRFDIVGMPFTDTLAVPSAAVRTLEIVITGNVLRDQSPPREFYRKVPPR